MNKGWVIGIISLLIVGTFIVWLFIESSKPLPGEKVTELSRKHVEIGTKVNYNSNPPTSGDHYSDWIRVGVFDSPKDDKNLVHSLEHGYIILWYKCQAGNVPTEASTSAQASQGNCQARQNQLKSVFESKGKKKLIVMPRENLETNFALTAWGRIDKFNDFDKSRIEKFIDAFRDQGPERTVE